ncbi:HTH-type transcriptional regulator TtgR [compost metagenome]
MLSKAEQTRQFIIERSAPIFNRKGYAATTMNDILKATGMAKGGVYGNFGSKDEIAVAAFQFSYDKLKTALRDKIKNQSTAMGKLLSIINFYHNYTLNDDFSGGCPIQNTAVDADDHIPFLKTKAAAALNEMLGSLEHIILKGIEKGEFRKDLDAQSEALQFFSMIEGGIMMSKVTDQPGVLSKLLHQLEKQIVIRFI